MKTFRITHHRGRIEEVEADHFCEAMQRMVFQDAGFPVMVDEKKALLRVDKAATRQHPAARFPARHFPALPSSARL